jgi:hypothetical protein
LGPIGAKAGLKPDTTPQNKIKRTNQIDLSFSLFKQGVAGSIPATSTKFPRKLHLLLIDGFRPWLGFTAGDAGFCSTYCSSHGLVSLFRYQRQIEPRIMSAQAKAHLYSPARTITSRRSSGRVQVLNRTLVTKMIEATVKAL